MKRYWVCMIVIAMASCGPPSADNRQNRRLVDFALTAVTTKNAEELTKMEALLDQRHGEGLLSQNAHEALKKIIIKARSGQWSDAEKELYQFRESNPFPK